SVPPESVSKRRHEIPRRADQNRNCISREKERGHHRANLHGGIASKKNPKGVQMVAHATISLAQISESAILVHPRCSSPRAVMNRYDASGGRTRDRREKWSIDGIQQDGPAGRLAPIYSRM